MDGQLKRGFIEVGVLAAMLKDETYGYKLIKDVSDYMEISESTLYPVLKRLEASGCLVVRSAEHNGRLRKYYSITLKGRGRVGEFLEDFKDVKSIYEYVKKEYENE